MENPKLKPKFTWDDVKSLAEKMLLPECSACEDRPSEEKDFLEIKPAIEAGFIAITSQMTFLNSINLALISAEARNGVVSLLMVCGEHSTKNCWTTNLTLKSCETLQNMMCKICSCQNVKDIICSKSIFKNCLSNFCCKLTREKWRCYPASVVSFRWIVSHVEMPLLGEHLPMVFPPTLLVLDDFDLDNKILGCIIMNHIINNVTRAELKRQQLDDVLYEALHRMLYQREAGLIVPLVTCLASLLEKVESSYTQKLEMGRTDFCLGIMLRQMEMEQGLALRQAYARALPVLLKTASLSLLRWSQRLIRIFSEYLAIEDGSGGATQEYTLKALLWFLQQTWPRAHRLAPQSLSCLLRLLHDLTQPERSLVISCNTRTVLLDLVEQCLTQLANTAPDQCKEELKGSENLLFEPEFHDILNRTVLANR